MSTNEFRDLPPDLTALGDELERLERESPPLPAGILKATEEAFAFAEAMDPMASSECFDGITIAELTDDQRFVEAAWKLWQATPKRRPVRRLNARGRFTSAVRALQDPELYTHGDAPVMMVPRF